jgi:hypothetical protein
MVDEHNVSLELLVGNSLNQADPGNAGFESRLYLIKHREEIMHTLMQWYVCNGHQQQSLQFQQFSFNSEFISAVNEP